MFSVYVFFYKEKGGIMAKLKVKMPKKVKKVKMPKAPKPLVKVKVDKGKIKLLKKKSKLKKARQKKLDKKVGLVAGIFAGAIGVADAALDYAVYQKEHKKDN